MNRFSPVFSPFPRLFFSRLLATAAAPRYGTQVVCLSASNNRLAAAAAAAAAAVAVVVTIIDASNVRMGDHVASYWPSYWPSFSCSVSRYFWPRFLAFATLQPFRRRHLLREGSSRAEARRGESETSLLSSSLLISSHIGRWLPTWAASGRRGRSIP